MLEFKGTKGEWFNSFNKFSQISPNGESIIKAGEVGTPVAVLPMPLGGKNTKERNEANAKLIAVAPNLLKALQDINNAFDQAVKVNGKVCMTLKLMESIHDSKLSIEKALK